MRKFFTILTIALGLMLASGQMPATAQDSNADGTATEMFNEMSTEMFKEVFKDWVMRCVERDGLPPCDMVQSVFTADSQERLLQMSVAHLGRNDEVGIQIWVPTGVMVSGGVLFEIDGEDRVLDALQYTRCEADGCLVEAIVPAANLQPLRAGRKGAFAVLASTGQPRVIAVSLAGFSAALKTVSERNKQWFSNLN
ncbi:invasion associated locus B family protein [Alphaproteobacteria bacterium]|nr:invasion associated locus B family protein [Alphaproteobacteria bacterium]